MTSQEIFEWFMDCDTESGICTTADRDKATRTFHRGEDEVRDIAEAYRSAHKCGHITNPKVSADGRRFSCLLYDGILGANLYTADKFFPDDCGMIEDIATDFPADHYIHDHQ